ncbi:hypothetical protein BDM02DRAFT_3118914 [Thelephora ganbajun]|uniref:Uncharacterized protein n=1 Tax=Thelephora ganbajun TaxID=370292 RepID=A0ACB6Z943_THEGA|nr:hypothetical protein BDM02DRAFT_3118914 [Thelephora ganbajun]
MVATVTLALYDHILTFRDEVEYIWGAHRWLNKLIFIVNRYIVEAALVGTAYVTVELRPHLSNNSCKMYLIPVVSAAMTCMAVSHVMITLRVDALWNYNKKITYTMLGGFVVTYSVAVAFFIVTIVDLRKAVFFFPSVNSCLVSHSPHLANGIWAAMVSFDVFVFGLVLINAVDRPYREASEVVLSLRKDGIIFFLAILVIRAFNLIFSLKTGRSETFLVVYLMWVTFSITICRLVLRIEATTGQTSRLTSVQVWRPDTENFELKVANRRSKDVCSW